jgi:hypothetical protein
LLFGDFLLADLELSFQIRLAHFAVQQPETAGDDSFAHSENRLPNEMDRAQPGHQNQARQINPAENNDRSLAHRGTQNVATEIISNPSTSSLLVKKTRPVAQKPMLQT